MRVLFLNYEFPPLGGGSGNATYYLFKEFSKIEGLEIDLVTSSVDKHSVENFSSNVTVHRLDIGKGGNLHSQSLLDLLKYSVRSYFYSRKLISAKDYDLTHAFFGIPCGFIAMKLGLPYIVSLRGGDVPFSNPRFYWLDQLFFARLSRKVWKKARVVLANSKDLRERALAVSKTQRIGILANGVDIESYAPGEDPDTFTVVSTSRIEKRKGVDLLVYAFCRAVEKSPNIRLVLVGDGAMRKELEEYVLENGCAELVDFVGAVEKAEIASYYKKASVFALPSLNEGMSNSLLEAMSSGLPVIVTDTGGISSLVKDGEGGLYVEKGNIGDITSAILRLSQDEQLRTLMGKKNREVVLQMGWDSVASKLHYLYTAIEKS